MRVPDALPLEVAQGVHDFLWAQFEAKGARRSDPSTWPGQWTGINKKEIDRAIRPRIGPRLESAASELLGENNWRSLSTLGGLLCSFPQDVPDEWGVVSRIWHTDNDARAYLGKASELMLFTFYSSVHARGGGTLVLGGSHRSLEQSFSTVDYFNNPDRGAQSLSDALAKWHPFLDELMGRTPSPDRSPAHWLRPIEIHGVEAEVTELTGEMGDAVLCHPALLHATSMNCGAEPRIMRRTNFRRKKSE